MKGLILDTSGDTTLIALSDHGRLLDQSLSSSHQNSSLLASHIQTFLKEAHLAIAELNYIGIGIGPGSFLGTRIGVMLAKGFAYGLQIPLVSFCSLQAYHPPFPAQFSVIVDAKSKGVYLLNGIKTTESTVYESTPSLYSIEEFLALDQKNPIFITPNRAFLLNKLQDPEAIIEAPPSLPYLCQYCYEQFTLTHINSLDTLPIHYLRLS